MNSYSSFVPVPSSDEYLPVASFYAWGTAQGASLFVAAKSNFSNPGNGVSIIVTDALTNATVAGPIVTYSSDYETVKTTWLGSSSINPRLYTIRTTSKGGGAINAWAIF